MGVSAHKVYEVRSRSPAKQFAESASFAGASTAVGTHLGAGPRGSSPGRYGGGGSPLRSSYKPSYGRY